ncbi:hypothetical protein QE152_g5213 [Popillia japonica]|uniref:Uncharacterized protein n=1 Tax=Popillia japonica TaxID=7064 RepID=A0AAW1MLU0_POPJA
MVALLTILIQCLRVFIRLCAWVMRCLRGQVKLDEKSSNTQTPKHLSLEEEEENAARIEEGEITWDNEVIRIVFYWRPGKAVPSSEPPAASSSVLPGPSSVPPPPSPVSAPPPKSASEEPQTPAAGSRTHSRSRERMRRPGDNSEKIKSDNSSKNKQMQI